MEHVPDKDDFLLCKVGNGVDSHEEFDTLKVSEYPWYQKHLNQREALR